MAITVTKDTDPLTGSDRRAVSDHYENRGTLHFGAGYATGGEPVTPATFGFVVDLIDVTPQANGAEVPVFDKANSKILLYTADGTEAANASNPNADVRYVAKGR